jgi:hypothetical protein
LRKLKHLKLWKIKLWTVQDLKIREEKNERIMTEYKMSRIIHKIFLKKWDNKYINEMKEIISLVTIKNNKISK